MSLMSSQCSLFVKIENQFKRKKKNCTLKKVIFQKLHLKWSNILVQKELRSKLRFGLKNTSKGF